MKRVSLGKDIAGQTRPYLNASYIKKADRYFVIEKSTDLLIRCGPKPQPLTLKVLPDVSLKLQIVAGASSGDWACNLELGDRAVVEVFMADFLGYRGKVTVNGHLLGTSSRLDWNLAALSHGTDEKTYSVNFIHDGRQSTAKMTNHGIIEQGAKLTFTGKSHIVKGATDSATHQEARIIVFDEHGVGKADPTLAIDENEVSASHAATVGKINEDHLFYLQSRGLSADEARRLITFGYLKPTIERFSDDNVRQALTKALETRL